MSALEAFGNAGFRRYYIAAVSGVNGNWIFRVLLSWSAWDLTNSPSFVGLIAGLSLLPVAIVGPLFGAWTDRRPILSSFKLVSYGLLTPPLALFLLLITGLLTPPMVVVIALGFGVAIAAYHPVRQSLGPRLVEPPQIGSVVSLAALNFNLGRLLSPAIGGFLIGAVGMELAALISVGLFLPNLVLGPTLRPREKFADGERQGFLADLAEGLRAGWQRIGVRRSLMLTIAGLGPVRAVTELLALIADGEFDQGAQGLGLLTSAVGAGALLAAIFQVVAGPRLAAMALVRYGVIAAGFAGTAALTLAPNFHMALLCAPLAGFAGTYVGVTLQIGIQSRIEDELRARIMSLWMLSVTLSTSVLAFLISALSEVLGLGGATAWVLGVASVAVLALAMTRKRQGYDPR
ncbi:MFS transporter [Rhodalgimonas zhirmunskyi]|uniref:MFS transporter n=1 Tax=Rhodalgimonas zhirmunskyi TaxID=2964767 RepID=A0AAJ1U8L7_9RHOB|nr:MFS transporter [Rhodoalgimonas zhirmunskyi]MDQ2094964.1 MFS transporter [Rhodoalgimonas zhirmunskyi]